MAIRSGAQRVPGLRVMGGERFAGAGLVLRHPQVPNLTER